MAYDTGSAPMVSPPMRARRPPCVADRRERERTDQRCPRADIVVRRQSMYQDDRAPDARTKSPKRTERSRRRATNAS